MDPQHPHKKPGAMETEAGEALCSPARLPEGIHGLHVRDPAYAAGVRAHARKQRSLLHVCHPCVDPDWVKSAGHSSERVSPASEQWGTFVQRLWPVPQVVSSLGPQGKLGFWGDHLFLVICVCARAHVCMHVCAVPAGARRRTRIPGAGIAGDCELLMWVLVTKFGSLQEFQVS